jgi:hypothetical protein
VFLFFKKKKQKNEFPLKGENAKENAKNRNSHVEVL